MLIPRNVTLSAFKLMDVYGQLVADVMVSSPLHFVWHRDAATMLSMDVQD